MTGRAGHTLAVKGGVVGRVLPSDRTVHIAGVIGEDLSLLTRQGQVADRTGWGADLGHPGRERLRRVPLSVRALGPGVVGGEVTGVAPLGRQVRETGRKSADVDRQRTCEDRHRIGRLGLGGFDADDLRRRTVLSSVSLGACEHQSEQ